MLSQFYDQRDVLTIWAPRGLPRQTIHTGYRAVAAGKGITLNAARGLVHAALAAKGWRHATHRDIVRAFKALRHGKGEGGLV